MRYSNVFICFFWLRKGPSSQYVRNWRGDGVLPNAYSYVNGEGVSCLISTYALTSLFMFLAKCLSYSILFYL